MGNQVVVRGQAVRFAARLGARTPIVTVGVIIIAALALRLTNISYGLPHMYHPDESLLIMPALRIAQSGALRPGRYDYGSAFVYALAGIYRAAAAIGVLPPLAQLPVVDATPYPDVYPLSQVFLLGRMFAAVMNCVMIGAVYAAARRVTGSVGAISAAFLAAMSPITVALSRYVTTDPVLQTSLAVALVASLLVLEAPTWQRSLLAGLVVGVACSVKYPAAILVAPLVAAHMLARTRPRGLWPSVVGLAIVPIGFLATTPYAILDWSVFRGFVERQLMEHSVVSEEYLDGPSYLWYPRYLLSFGSATLSALGVAGWVALAFHRFRQAVVVVAFPVSYFVYISLAGPRAERYVLPLIPFLAVGAGYVVGWAVQRLRGLAAWVGAAALALALIWPVYVTLQHTAALSQPDVRDLAAAWIGENAAGSPVAADMFALPSDAPVGALLRVGSALDHTPSWYAENGYVVVANDLSRLHINRSPAIIAAWNAFDADPVLEQVAYLHSQMFGFPEYGVRVYRPRR